VENPLHTESIIKHQTTFRLRLSGLWQQQGLTGAPTPAMDCCSCGAGVRGGTAGCCSGTGAGRRCCACCCDFVALAVGFGCAPAAPLAVIAAPGGGGREGRGVLGLSAAASPADAAATGVISGILDVAYARQRLFPVRNRTQRSHWKRFQRPLTMAHNVDLPLRPPAAVMPPCCFVASRAKSTDTCLESAS